MDRSETDCSLLSVVPHSSRVPGHPEIPVQRFDAPNTNDSVIREFA